MWYPIAYTLLATIVTPSSPCRLSTSHHKKNSINLYHSGIYVQDELLEWFQEEYPKHVKTKLDMGKSCIRFKKIGNIPYKLIGELVGKMSVQDWGWVIRREGETLGTIPSPF
jgi:hypothetical protein